HSDREAGWTDHRTQARRLLAQRRPSGSGTDRRVGESRRGSEVRNILIDFGYQSQTLLNNMSVMSIDPASLDALVLSHGHYDHFGGWSVFCQRTRASSRTACLSSSAEKTVFARARPMPASMARSTVRRSWTRS